MENKENNQMNNVAEGSGSPSKKVKGIIHLVIYIAVVLLLVFLFVQFVAIRTKVTSSSMENTLSKGDSVMVDKITYRFKDPKRFDIIVFPFDKEKDTYYIKRIIGLPGETVLIDKEGVIYINGEKLDESYGNEKINANRLGLAAEEITLAEDEYFVLGDNRNDGSDSRSESVGNIKRKDIIGKVWFRIYPFNEIGRVK